MNAIDFICDFLGYEMQYTNNYNMDSYIIYAGIMLMIVMMILFVYLIMRFFQWIWGCSNEAAALLPVFLRFRDKFLAG